MQNPNLLDRKPTFRTFLIDFCAGGVSVAISKTIIAPIDRIKLILQVQHANTNQPKGGEYKGIIDAFTRISRDEGMQAFWRGNFANILRYFPSQALNLAIKDVYRNWFVGGISPKQTLEYAVGNFLNGAAAGATTLFVSYPLDFARTRLATDIGSATTRRYKGIIHCLTSCVEMDGFLGLYRGFVPAFVGITLFRSIYFGGYDTISTLFLSSDHSRANVANAPVYQRFFLAQGVTIIAGMIVYPLDTIRRRLMVQGGSLSHGALYNGTFDCFSKITKEEGATGLYKGLSANIFRSIGGALILVLYDDFRKILHQ